MAERDCEHCAYARRPYDKHDNGCTAWSCEFINYKDAIKAWKEKHKRKTEQTEREGE